MKKKLIVLVLIATLSFALTANAAPTVYNRSPADGATDVSREPTLTAYVNSTNATSVYFMWNNSGTWVTLKTFTGANFSAEKCSFTATQFDDYTTTYHWTVNVSDGSAWTNSTEISLKTVSPSGESADVFANIVPVMATFIFLMAALKAFSSIKL
jgi:hypothetical protein